MLFKPLPPDAQQLLTTLGQQPLVRSFYLAGGSAASFHMGHRLSVDLDFFTPDKEYDSQPLVEDLEEIGELVVQQRSRKTLVGSLDGVLISFFLYPYPLLQEPTELDNIQIASLLDIALMKLIAIGQRGKKRDFIDLYFICQQGYSLDELLARFPDKFTNISFSIYHTLRSLTYFEDAENDPPPNMLVSYNWEEIKQFFQNEVRRLTQKL